MSEFKVTEVQVYMPKIEGQDAEGNFYTDESEYYGNIVINDSFIIQFHGNCEESTYSFPSSEDAFWASKEDQDSARESFDLDDVTRAIESSGLENNRFWMEENAVKCE